jgi:hypothetical protein
MTVGHEGVYQRAWSSRFDGRQVNSNHWRTNVIMNGSGCSERDLYMPVPPDIRPLRLADEEKRADRNQ